MEAVKAALAFTKATERLKADREKIEYSWVIRGY
jgi:hypothetical protein